MILSYNPLRIFLPIGVALTVLGIGKLVYDLVDKDFRVATNTLADPVRGVPGDRDRLARRPRRAGHEARHRSRAGYEVAIARAYISRCAATTVDRSCRATAGAGSGGAGSGRARRAAAQRVGVVRSDEHASARGHDLGKATGPRGDHRPTERERLDGDETEPLPTARNDDGVGREHAGVQRSARDGIDEGDRIAEAQPFALGDERTTLGPAADELEAHVSAGERGLGPAPPAARRTPSRATHGRSRSRAMGGLQGWGERQRARRRRSASARRRCGRRRGEAAHVPPRAARPRRRRRTGA